MRGALSARCAAVSLVRPRSIALRSVGVRQFFVQRRRHRERNARADAQFLHAVVDVECGQSRKIASEAVSDADMNVLIEAFRWLFVQVTKHQLTGEQVRERRLARSLALARSRRRGACARRLSPI